MIDAVRKVLDTKSVIAGHLHGVGFDGPVIADALKTAATHSIKLSSLIDKKGALLEILQRVDLSPGNLRLTLILTPLISMKGRDAVCPLLVRDIPIQIRRRGVEMKLSIEGQKAHGKIDPVLIKAVARGNVWFEELRSGATRTIRDIATKFGVSESYVNSLLPLAFLAPDIVEDIIHGRQPTTLSGERLIKQLDLPSDWMEQRRVLGFT